METQKKNLLHFDKFTKYFNEELIEIAKSMMSFNPVHRPAA